VPANPGQRLEPAGAPTELIGDLLDILRRAAARCGELDGGDRDDLSPRPERNRHHRLERGCDQAIGRGARVESAPFEESARRKLREIRKTGQIPCGPACCYGRRRLLLLGEHNQPRRHSADARPLDGQPGGTECRFAAGVRQGAPQQQSRWVCGGHLHLRRLIGFSRSIAVRLQHVRSQTSTEDNGTSSYDAGIFFRLQ
jgi:hypothetical protein